MIPICRLHKRTSISLVEWRVDESMYPIHGVNLPNKQNIVYVPLALGMVYCNNTMRLHKYVLL